MAAPLNGFIASLEHSFFLLTLNKLRSMVISLALNKSGAVILFKLRLMVNLLTLNKLRLMVISLTLNKAG